MGAALLITFRETLEASLIVGIILAYLNKTGNHSHRRYVWSGVAAGIVVSVILAVVFEQIFGGFEGRAEEIYEGVTMLIAAGLLTWMILWMLMQRRTLRKNLEHKVESHIKGDHPWGIFFLTFVSIAREGIETVIFLKAAMVQSEGNPLLLGGAVGILAAILLSFLLFKGIAGIELRKFFTVTSVILILFAAGLVAHGVHEFQEAGVLSMSEEPVWDMNFILNDKGAIGGILRGLLGYNGNPSLIEVLSYWGYLVIIGLVWRRINHSLTKEAAK